MTEDESHVVQFHSDEKSGSTNSEAPAIDPDARHKKWLEMKRRYDNAECCKYCFHFSSCGWCILFFIGLLVTALYDNNKKAYISYVNSGVANTDFSVMNMTISTTKCTQQSVSDNCYIGVLQLNITQQLTINDTTQYYSCYTEVDATRTDSYTKTQFQLNDQFRYGMHLNGSYTLLNNVISGCNLQVIIPPVEGAYRASLITVWVFFFVFLISFLISSGNMHVKE
jgi:hypothetical protein